MRPGFLLALLYLAIAPSVLAQNASFIAGEISRISPCGLKCLTQTIPGVGCSLTNTTCQCSSTRLVQTTSACMMANCTLAQTLDLSKIQAAICNRPNESQNRKIRIMTIVCAIITNSAALLRFVTRLSLHQTFGSDDWFIAAAVVTESLFTYFGFQLERNGFGEHVWNIDLDIIPRLFYWFYVCEILYVITIGFVKISILFFYLRVFPKKSFRIACWATMAFCGASALGFALITVFQCHPIIYIWRKDLTGKCVNYNSVAWANAGINIFQDVMIILLPMNELRHLQLNKRKKTGMYAMFGVGSFVCITSMVRLDSLRSFGLTADPTWDNIPTTFWSTLETTTAIFCACMPSIRAGLVRLFPKALGPTTHPMSSNPNVSSFVPKDKHVLSRAVNKHTQKFISLLPLKIRMKANETSQAEMHTWTGTNLHDGTSRDGMKQEEPRSIPYNPTASQFDCNKPLPLTPTRSILSMSLSLSTIEEGIDIEKSTTGNGSSDDISRLV